MGKQCLPVESCAARWRYRQLAGVAWLFSTAACHSMRAVQVSQLVTTPTKRIWVTQTDHSTVVLDAPLVNGDTLAGFVDGQFREMPLSQAASIRTLQPDRGRTALLAVAAGVAALGTFAYFENRSYVGKAQTCSTGFFGDLPVDCCKVQNTQPC